MPWPGVGRSVGNSGHHPSSTAISFCQEAPRKVIISKRWELPKPPLQRGTGKGSDIPRKTQLRDSSYLVKSMIVVVIFFFFNSLFYKISLGTSVRGDIEKCSLSLLKTDSGSPQLGLLITLFLVFIPKGARISLASCPSSPTLLTEKRARDRRFPFQVENHGKHRQSLMGRERSSQVQPRLWEASRQSSATAKGTREVQTRKAVQASLPAIFCSDTNIWWFSSSLQSLPHAR